MLERFLGKRKSIQRSLIRSFITFTILIMILTVLEFMIFILPSIHSQLENSNINTDESLYVINRILGLTLTNIILISIMFIRINMKKILQPIQQINEATKQVAAGDYDIKLESKREDEIGELTQNFSEMTKELKRTENVQKEFINNVSHEIKTPISSIKGFAQLLKDKNLSDTERQEYSDIIVEESERLINLTGKMLKLAKLHNQDKIINKQKILIEEQIRKAVSLLEPKWGKKGIKINTYLEKSVFFGDEELIFQVLLNLLENAIKFSKDNSKIDIKAYNFNENIKIIITDYGIGMQKDEVEKVFEKFYQIDKSHSEEGCGLGLAIVKRIIELSDGKIQIKSMENEGTTIIIQLPKRNSKVN